MSFAVRMQPERQAYWPDERLVSECLKRNEQAWAALIDKYKNLIYSIAIKLGMYNEAGDIFQAVCLDLLTDLPRLREPRALPKWLMQTSYHKCLRRRRQSEKLVPLADDGDQDAAQCQPLPLPEDMLVELEREQMLREAISQLSPRCGRLVRMLFFETPPRSYREIASELALATGSIGFMRGNCLHKLKKQLEKLGF